VIEQRKVQEFLANGPIAVVGASDDPKNFGGTVGRALVEHGIDVVYVNPKHDVVGGEPCYATVKDIPGEVGGVLVMVGGAGALDVIRNASARGVRRIWLFKGLGGPGAASDEAVALCMKLRMDVVAGACPMMFLEPVRGGHRFHRFLRRTTGAVGKAA
jgi:predicted CoA-binding protein